MDELVKAFIDDPSASILNSCSKKQISAIADHYKVDIGDQRRTVDCLKEILSGALEEQRILVRASGSEELSAQTVLTFEQQNVLLSKQGEIARLQLELEQTKLRVLREQREANLAPGRVDPARAHDGSDGSGSNLRFVPKFNERDPDTFFTLFERVSEAKQWPDSERILLLQCVLTGKGQEAYAAVCAQESLTYEQVKAAVLKAYQLTAEAYRHRFRYWSKGERQTHVEFANDLTTQFKRWCVAAGVATFDQLSELIVLEQFKNKLPGRVVSYLNEKEPSTVLRAAGLADDFVLTHRFDYERAVPRRESGDVRGERSSPVRKGGGRSGFAHGADVCHHCKKVGHWKDKCPLRSNGRASPAMLCAGAQKPESIGQQVEAAGSGFEPFLMDACVSLEGSADVVNVRVLRDTGAKHSFILESALPFSSESQVGDFIVMRGMELGYVPVPRHKVVLQCDLVSGVFPVAVRHALPLEGVDMVLGNDICGSAVWASGPPSPVVVTKPLPQIALGRQGVFPVCAVTRAQAKLGAVADEGARVRTESVRLPGLPDTVSRDDWISELKRDSSLKPLFGEAVSEAQVRDMAQGYFVLDSILVRKWSNCKVTVSEPVFQLVVPKAFRHQVLKTAHDQSGHLGVQKTYWNVLKHFFWHRLKTDVAAYVRSCHVCQLTGKPNQNIKPAPLHPIPVQHEPFEYLVIDCVGPLPVAKSGCKYLLTVMCQATRYPAAFPLRSITTKSVVKAVTQFVSVFGLPKVIQSDRGSNFTSHMFAQVLRVLGVKHNRSTPYHAESQGVLERFHQTLKSLLRAFCVELDRDWEEGVPWLLMAAREAVQESTGFSPNDLVFGHVVRGPLAMLKGDLLSAQAPTNLIDYVNGFRHRLYTAGCLAREKLKLAQEHMKKGYDRRA